MSADGAVVPAVAAEDLQIAGVVPLSSVDWPGHLVATVFCQGCPWTCTYCHNTAILDPRTPGAVGWAQLEQLLGRRHGLLDAVVFSGGEATMQHALVPAARRVRGAGFAVGLHTGGAYPGRLAALLGQDRDGARSEAPLVDWVGFDVKASPAGYPALVGRAGAATKVQRSLGMLLNSGVDHELRMTVTPALQAEVLQVVRLVAQAGGGALVLQRARPDGADAGFAAQLARAPDWPERFEEIADAATRRGKEEGVQVRART
ncbi:MAG: anaerobic ribonucleoside-triphosphate reductase activating protein [Brachybacterium sp.]|uniref:anaerobic ribonucleoside-triphosphate reductase activating protein n=1 Tax=unclassified Brachybacterium TaxID=2623841 RepID=UPI003F9197D0